ncbi:MAG: ring-cleaving dioxygenase [Vicinamibacterales bacterium]
MRSVTGLHHVTAIAGSPQENLDFYTGILGVRLVKKSVNQDDPGTYHLFYADAEGNPGTDLTFFPWTAMAPSRPGHGLSVEVALAVPPGTLRFWGERLERHGVPFDAVEARFGERALPLTDPHGLRVALVESEDSVARKVAPWVDSPVAADRQIRGLHAVRLWEASLAPTSDFLANVLGLRGVGEESGWHRYLAPGGTSGRIVDVREVTDARRGAWGIGSIHHVAWRVDDEEHQAEVRQRVEDSGRRPTPVIDRFWFKSVYFAEPGGVLFELATDGPGFAIDEDAGHLGERLVLPPWLEPERQQIEASLPALTHGRKPARLRTPRAQ